MDVVTQSRGRNAAIAGIVVQSILTAAVAIIWLWTGSLSAMAAWPVLGGGVALWAITWLVFYGRLLERREAMELDQIAARAGSSAIFAQEGQDQLRPAARRLRLIDRWLAPLFTLLWACFHVAVGVVMLVHLSSRPAGSLSNSAQGILFCVLLAFVAFLFSRYATGMSSLREYRPLRAGGSYLLVNALLIAVVAAGLAFAARSTADSHKIDKALSYVFPILQLILAGELALNLLLEIYRPRLPGQEQRLSFDSRLLDLLAQPGRVGHSIAETLNYQFGFEVSKTWFYQLAGKAMAPLLVFGAAVLAAMTSVVVVDQGQEAVVFHLGKMQPQTLGPGVHLKWPWPIDTVDRFDTGAVHEILLGVGQERTEAQRRASMVKGRELMLWKQEHGAMEEKDFLVASAVRAAAAADAARHPPVNVIKLVASLQYVIEQPRKYGYKHADPAKTLQNVAYREMVRYCAAATLDEPVPAHLGKRPEAIMTFGRAKAADELKGRIQQAVGPDGLDLGVRITSLSFCAIHPPAQAAGAYEEVHQAERGQDEQRYEAQAEANKILAEVAGSPVAALKLALSIRILQELEGLARIPDNAALVAKVDQLTIAAERDLELTAREIRRERLLGKLAPDRSSAMQELEKSQQEYAAILRQIRRQAGDDPSSVDLQRHVQEAYGRCDELFDQATGEPAKLVAQARSERWGKEMSERARAEAFSRQLLAFEASPNVYMFDRWLDVLDEVLPSITKYVLGVDPDRVELRLNLENQQDILQHVTFQPQEQP